MFNVTVLTTDGSCLSATEASYSLNDGLLIIEVAAGTNFFNFNHVIYFGASPVGE
jgi:hypothetical protein